MSDDKVFPVQCKFWILWVLVSTLAGALGLLVDMIVVSYLYVGWLPGVMRFILPIALQWVLLRQRVYRAGLWVLANTLFFVLTVALSTLQPWSGFLSLLAPVAQVLLWWLVLRQWGRQVGLWVSVGSVVGYLASTAITRLGEAVGLSVGTGLTGIFVLVAIRSAVSETISGLLFVLVFRYPSADLLRWYTKHPAKIPAQLVTGTIPYIVWGLVLIGAIAVTLVILYWANLLGLGLVWWGMANQWLWVIVIAILGVLWGSIIFGLIWLGNRSRSNAFDQTLPSTKQDILDNNDGLKHENLAANTFPKGNVVPQTKKWFIVFVTLSFIIARLLLGFPFSTNKSDHNLEAAEIPPGQIALDCKDASDERKRYLCVMDTDGSNETAIAGPFDSVRKIAWSPDGKSIAFLVRPWPRDNIPDQVFWAIDADGSNLVHLADDVLSFWWLPDSTRIAFERNTGSWFDIQIIHRDGSNPYELISPRNYSVGPAWSTDRAHIAFRDRRDQDMGIYVMNSDGSDLHRAVDISTFPDVIALSPDKNHIAFATPLDKIYVADAQSEQAWLAAKGEGPRWSPDGQRIAYYRGCAVYVMDIASLSETKLNSSTLFANRNSYRCISQISWSPDGQYIAFHSHQGGLGGISNLVVVRSDRTEQRIVAKDVYGYSWSPDGQYLVFSGTTQDLSITELYIVQVRNGYYHRLTYNNNQYYGPPAWRP